MAIAPLHRTRSAEIPTPPGAHVPAPTAQPRLAADRIDRSALPPPPTPSRHGFGLGIAIGVTAEGGLPGLGAGGNASGGVGLFADSPTHVQPGAFVGAGAFADAGHGRFAAPANAGPAAVLGAYAGAGYGLFVTNALSARALAGVAQTYALNLGFGPKISVQLGASPDGTFVGSLTVGPGLGLDVSHYATRSSALSP